MNIHLRKFSNIRNFSYLSPSVKILSFENTKKNEFSFGILLTYSYLCPVNDKTTANMATDKTGYWLDIADYDLDTAEAMHQTGRWLYVAFMCHQVIEKTLKAYWCATRDDDPPYTHNHKRLADGCGLYQQLTTDQREFIETITNYNIEARYPEDKEELARTLTPQACRQIIDETKQMQQWIKEHLPETRPSNSSADTNES